jgi:hypothetical protein
MISFIEGSVFFAHRRILMGEKKSLYVLCVSVVKNITANTSP